MIEIEPEEYDIDIQDSFLAPWGLANEDLPLHLIWEGDTDSIEISIPENFDIDEIHNINDGVVDIEEDKVRLPTEDLHSEGYLSAIFSTSEIHKSSVTPYSFAVRFLKDGIVQRLWHGTTRIIRPKIEVINYPKKITLEADSEVDPIEIDMQYVGFGMAEVAVEAEAGGELVSQGETLAHDFLRSMLETDFHKQDIEELGDIPEEWENETNIEVPEEEIDEIVGDMRDVAQEGDIFEEFEPEELHDLANILEMAEVSSKSDSDVASAIYKEVEMMLLSSILDVVDRHPTDNVSLRSPQTKIKTEARARELEVKVLLSDNKNNSYDSKDISIEIDDRRSNGGMFETEIVTNWVNYEVDPTEVFNND